MGGAPDKCCRDNIVPQATDNAPSGPADAKSSDTAAAGAPPPAAPAPPAPVPAAQPNGKQGAQPAQGAADDQELDKIRLRTLTTEFVQDVIKGGIPVTVLGMDANTREQASYSLDRSLRTFYVKKESETTAKPYKIVNIRDIWIGTEFAQFQKSHWNTDLIQAEKEKVVAIQFSDAGEKDAGGPDEEQVLLLMESNRSTAVRFVQAMTILRLYNSGTANDLTRA